MKSTKNILDSMIHKQMFTSLSISFKMDSQGNSPPSNEDSSNESIPQVPQADDEILFEFFPSEKFK